MSGSSESDFRILGVDPGAKRFGLAVSDPLLMTAQGLETFEAADDNDFLRHLRSVIDRYNVRIVVLGLPLSMSGGDIEGTERSRSLAGRIKKEFSVEVALRDERMTSLEAERVLEQAGRMSAAGDVDRLAAVLLLQGYLDEREQ
jgi:putative Holliday junction resolvase